MILGTGKFGASSPERERKLLSLAEDKVGTSIPSLCIMQQQDKTDISAPDPKYDADPGPHSDPGPDSGPGPSPGPQSDPGPDAGPGPDCDLGPASGLGPDPDRDLDPEVEFISGMLGKIDQVKSWIFAKASIQATYSGTMMVQSNWL